MSENRLSAELDNLRKRGTALPASNARAAIQAHSMHNLAREAGSLRATVEQTIRSDGASPEVQRILEENRALTSAMGGKRLTNQRMTRVAAASTGVGGDVHAAIPRFYDPMEYWDLSGLPWNVANEGHRHKLHKWLRLYYATHYLIPILVDIFTRFPLVGMTLESKDPYIKDFYEDLFFDQLDYENFLVSLGREFWIVGEAFPLASFDEDLKVWEREELINPEQVTVENFQLIGADPQLKVTPPDHLKRLVDTKSPAKEYRQLEISFPELIPYLRRGDNIPISNVLLKQVANRLNDWDDRGTPILLRGLRTLLHEEKLMASQDAIAERLYSPLILAKLGIMDLGDNQGPWIPGPEEIEAVRDDFDMALASDFRLIVHHFGLEVNSVFGREQMPRLGDDFDRIERRLMQVFGVNPSLLSAGASTQPYASSALQAEFLNQILRTFQKALKDHFKQRAMVVAEAQGHQDYKVKGQTRIPLFEEYVEYDLEGNKTIKERPKLLIPELEFATLDLRDEATERQFLQSLRQMGVPIPDQDLMVGIKWDIKDKIKTYNDELKEKTIAQQQAKMEVYTALHARGLPIPVDLAAEVQSVLNQGTAPTGAPGGAMPGAGPQMGPGGGVVMPPPPPGIGGPGGGLGPEPGTAGPEAAPGGGPPPTAPFQPGRPGTVPEVSNERRPGLTYNTKTSTDESEDATIEDDVEPEEPQDEELGPREELVGEKGDDDEIDLKTARIVERTLRPRAEIEQRTEKKYSIVDPDADPLDDDDNVSEEEEPSESSDTESTGPTPRSDRKADPTGQEQSGDSERVDPDAGSSDQQA